MYLWVEQDFQLEKNGGEFLIFYRIDWVLKKSFAY